MTKKKKNLKKQKIIRKEKYNDSSTSTEMNDLLYDVKNLNLDKENDDLVKDFILSSKTNQNEDLKNITVLSRPKGLYNLGNTCYLNSIIQVLNQTPLFYELLNERADSGINWNVFHNDLLLKFSNDQVLVKNDKILNTKLVAPTILSSCLVTLLHSLKSELKSSSSVVKPDSFFREVTSNLNKFKRYDQQDSYEFLRCLLDALKVGEIKRQQKAVLDALNLNYKQLKNCDEDTKNLIKGYSNASNFTLIDSLFGGYCISSLKCEDCENTSQIFEPFLDLSLAINEENTKYNIRRQKNTYKQNQIENELILQNKNLLKENLNKLSVKERRTRKQLRKTVKKESKKAEKLNKNLLLNEKNDKSILKESTIIKNDNDDEKNSLEDSFILNDKNDKDKIKDSSDDENSSKEEDALDLNKKKEKVKNQGFKILLNSHEKFNNFNSIDSGINHSNFTSDGDSTKVKILIKNSILPLHEEYTDTENVNLISKDINNLNSDEKESDTGFEDKESVLNGEADSESESSNASVIEKDTDSEEIENQNKKILPNENLFNDEKSDEKKSICSSSQIEKDEVFKKKINWTLTTLTKLNSSDNFSILTCLSRFTKLELLVGSNRIYCENCSNKYKNKNGIPRKIYTNGSKQTLIAIPPLVLTLHLKRFEVNSYRNLNISKINKHVPFPLVFNLSPYVSKVYKIISNLSTNENSNDYNKPIIYHLYGIVEHLGSMRSGHYKAYIKHQSKTSNKIKKFLKIKPYVPKILDILELITHEDLLSNEEEELINSEDLNLRDELLNVSKDKWFHISDSEVISVPLKSVLKAQAYILFYERVI